MIFHASWAYIWTFRLNMCVRALVICVRWTTSKFIFDACVVVWSVSHIYIRMYVLGPLTFVQMCSFHTSRKKKEIDRKKEENKKERQQVRNTQIETEKGSKYIQTQWNRTMQANITICTNTNVHAVPNSHTHTHTHVYHSRTHTHTHWARNVRWPLFTSTHFIDKRNNNNKNNDDDDDGGGGDDSGQRRKKKHYEIEKKKQRVFFVRVQHYQSLSHTQNIHIREFRMHDI